MLHTGPEPTWLHSTTEKGKGQISAFSKPDREKVVTVNAGDGQRLPGTNLDQGRTKVPGSKSQVLLCLWEALKLLEATLALS